MIKNKTEKLFNIYQKYDSRKKPVSVGTSCFKEEYYQYILRKYKKSGAENLTISISEYYNDLFFVHFSENKPLKRTNFIIEIMEFGKHLLKKCPKKPIFDDRSEFIMFFLRYYYFHHYLNKKETTETSEYLIIDGKRYNKNGVA